MGDVTGDDHRRGMPGSSETLTEGVLRALAEPSVMVTSTGEILAANGAGASLLGARADALRGASLADFVGDEQTALRRYLGSCARSGSPVLGALHPRSASGVSRRGVEGSVVSPAKAGAPAVILLRFRAREGAGSRFILLNQQLEASTREVRARRRAEQALREANERLQAQALEVETANQQLQDQAVELEQQVDAAQALAEELESANDALVRVNEQLEETTSAAVAARRDAEAANRAKSDFLATMSHELRTPLNAIGGFVDLLELGIRGPVTPTQRDDLERIRRAQRHLLVLINALLGFARIEAGHVRYEMTAVSVDAVLRGLESLIGPLLLENGLNYTYEPVADDVTVWADREKLEQILINLLSNAIKFTPSGGSLSVRCETDGSRLRIMVRDTGIGIAADDLERVFEPFVQIDHGLTRSRDGVGLGLAISRDLARGMDGDLTVESTPKRGSTFTVTLPVAPPTA